MCIYVYINMTQSPVSCDHTYERECSLKSKQKQQKRDKYRVV